MSFWSTEKLLKSNPEAIFDDFNPKFAQHGAYELKLGPEAFITSGVNDTKQRIRPGKQISIPPGQFGLLMTQETLAMPTSAIAFISIKFSIKQRGLVNVSGFHVDPGFRGRLKFTVYNAGSRDIILSRGEPVFMIWFSDFDQVTKDAYDGEHNNQNEITSDDVMKLKGEIASPAALKKQIEDLRGEFDRRLSVFDEKISTWKQITIAVLTGLIALFLLVLRSFFFEGPPSQRNVPNAIPTESIQQLDRNKPSSSETNMNATTQNNNGGRP